MYRSFKTLLLALLISGIAACGKSRPIPDPDVKYGKGFFNEETSNQGTWRWMTNEGVIALKNHKSDMHLMIVGRVPDNQFRERPKMVIKLNGETLDSFEAPEGPFRKEYQIKGAQMVEDSWSELRIATDKTFVPKEKDKNSSDERHLGFKLHELAWDRQ